MSPCAARVSETELRTFAHSAVRSWRTGLWLGKACSCEARYPRPEPFQTRLATRNCRKDHRGDAGCVRRMMRRRRRSWRLPKASGAANVLPPARLDSSWPKMSKNHRAINGRQWARVRLCGVRPRRLAVLRVRPPWRFGVRSHIADAARAGARPVGYERAANPLSGLSYPENTPGKRSGADACRGRLA